MGVLESFERYCKREKITSEQYKGDIWPIFKAGYKAGVGTKGRTTPQVMDVELDGEQDRQGLDLSD